MAGLAAALQGNQAAPLPGVLIAGAGGGGFVRGFSILRAGKAEVDRILPAVAIPAH